MSKEVEQILLLMMTMREEAKDIFPISSRRNLACQVIADTYGIEPKVMLERCMTLLNADTDMFDDLLRRLIENGDKQILQTLRKIGDAKDQADIDEFERYLQIKHIKLAPSILSADFARLGEQVAEAEKAGADYIHVDVMDGHFVPNITVGIPIVAAVKKSTKLPLDVHLMIEEPERHLSQFVEAGAGIITVHIEACPHIHRTVQTIKDLGAKAGVALNPGTPMEAIKEILPYVDLVLVMTVNPGFGGQEFIKGMLGKISRLRAELDRYSLAAELEVDGGINAEVAPDVVRAGAAVLVAGAAVFKSEQNIAEALGKIRANL